MSWRSIVNIMLGGALCTAIYFMFSWYVYDFNHKQLTIKAQSIKYQESEQLLVTKVDVVVEPELMTLGNQFTLFEGLKLVLDNVLLRYEESPHSSLTALANAYCKTTLLSIEGCRQFVALFERYVAYKTALQGIEEETVNVLSKLQEIEYRLEQLEALQRQFFSEEEIIVLFGEDKALQESALERYRIASDSTLSKEQKQMLLEHHLLSLNGTQKKALAPSIAIHEIQRIQSLEDGEEYKRATIEAEYGADIEERLTMIEQKQKQFDQQLRDLQHAYLGVPDEQKVEWLAQYFEGNTARRAKVRLDHGLLTKGD